MSFYDQLNAMAGTTGDTGFVNTLDTLANITPTSTTLNYNPDGSTDITHKMTAGPVAPSSYSGASGAGPSYTAPSFQMPQMPSGGPQLTAPQPGTPAGGIGLRAPAAQQAPQQMPQQAPQQMPQQMQMPAQPTSMQIPNAQVSQQPTMWNDYANPANLPTAQPSSGQGIVAPQVTPVAPGQTTNVVTPTDLMGNQIFANMLQAESGNQDYLPNGQPVTSPKGAMYAAQVMPETAHNPGYGIRPVTNDSATEYDRVGKEYHEAMRKKYDGDEEKAVAAYNAGPGRVDHAIALAQQNGGDWKQYLPAETQQYLAKVNPGAAVQNQANMKSVDDIQREGLGKTTGNTEHDDLIAAGNDMTKLGSIYSDTSGRYSDATKMAAAQTMYDTLAHQEGIRKAKDDLIAAAQTGNMGTVANKMRQNNPEGSRFRAMLYELAGAKQAAADEYNKLGVGSAWQPGMIMDDKGRMQRYAVYMTPDGQARRAIDSSTGQEVTDPKILATLNGGGMGGNGMKLVSQRKGENSGTTYDILTDKNGNTFYRNSKTQEVSPTISENLVNLGTKTLNRQEQEQAMKAKNAFIANQDKIAAASGGWNHHPTYRNRQEMLEDAAQQHQSMLNGTTQIPANLGEPAKAEETKPTGFAAFNPADPVDVQAMRVLKGQEPAPSAGRTGTTSIRADAVMRRVRELQGGTDKTYDPTLYERNKKTLDSYEGTGQNSKDVRSLVTSVNHIASLDPIFKDLHNGKYPTANAFFNDIGRASGAGAPVAAQIGQELVTGEINKFLTSGKGGTEAERNELRAGISPNASPEQLDTAIKTYKKLLTGKLDTYKNQYESAGGDFWGHIVQNPDAKAMYDRSMAEDRVRAGKSVEGTSNGVKFKKVTQQ